MTTASVFWKAGRVLRFFLIYPQFRSESVSGLMWMKRTLAMTSAVVDEGAVPAAWLVHLWESNWLQHKRQLRISVHLWKTGSRAGSGCTLTAVLIVLTSDPITGTRRDLGTHRLQPSWQSVWWVLWFHRWENYSKFAELLGCSVRAAGPEGPFMPLSLVTIATFCFPCRLTAGIEVVCSSSLVPVLSALVMSNLNVAILV